MVGNYCLNTPVSTGVPDTYSDEYPTDGLRPKIVGVGKADTFMREVQGRDEERGPGRGTPDQLKVGARMRDGVSPINWRLLKKATKRVNRWLVRN